MNKYLLKNFKEKAVNIGIDLKTILTDEIQAAFLEIFYKNPASNGAVLFGGGRFRHINNSIRFSVDLDFFRTKGFDFNRILNFVSGKFISLLKQNFGVSARIIDTPPWKKTHNIETIRLLIYDEEKDFHQLEIDLDFIKREPCLDCENGLLRNVVIVTSRDSEALEEKLISIYERKELKVRDIFDFWYYRGLSKKLSKENIEKKIAGRGIAKESISRRLADFRKQRNYYLKEIKNIIESCGQKRQEVNNLLKLDMNVIMDYIIDETNKYLLAGEE